MKWIDIEGPVPSKSGKTNIWTVVERSGSELGTVQWFGRWRKYVFIPAAGTVYEEDCLRDIASFCEQASKEFRQSKKTSHGQTRAT